MMKLPIVLLALAVPGLALAQAPAGAPPLKNLFSNGSFEMFSTVDNLWDGVDSNGYLAGATGDAVAITESGAVRGLPMPLSVQVADLNGDHLPDLFTVDQKEYFRVYFNSGTPTEPKFTHAEMVPIFLSRFSAWNENYRQSLKAALFDLNKTGAQDLIIGDYGGEILMLRNTGNRSAPDFRQPGNVDDLVIKTTKEGNLWGNLFAPAVYDWDGDGKPDILVGEGSYSANAVHLLLNEGSGSLPKFSAEGRYYLALGEGREHLMPTVVDYNGDGFPDLLVGDRNGTITIFLSEGRWSKDKVLKNAGIVTCGSTSKFNSCIAVATGDLNGDGLFDLVIGKTNGRIAVAYNTGTKEQPKFDSPLELKGVDVWNRTTIKTPTNWAVDFGEAKGNIYGCMNVVSEADDAEAGPIPDGKNVFKASYMPPLNKIIKFWNLIVPNTTDNDLARGHRPNAFWCGFPYTSQGTAASWAGYNTDANMVILRKVLSNSEVKPGQSYTLSFKIKGRSVKTAQWYLVLGGEAYRSEAKVTNRNERGGVKVSEDRILEDVTERGDFAVATKWGTVTRTVNFKFTKHKEFNDPDNFKGVKPPVYRTLLEIRATLAPGEGVFYADDVQLTLVPK